MKFHVRMIEKLLELPECPIESAGTSALRHTLDDMGLEVKGVEANSDAGVVFTIDPCDARAAGACGHPHRAALPCRCCATRRTGAPR